MMSKWKSTEVTGAPMKEDYARLVSGDLGRVAETPPYARPVDLLWKSGVPFQYPQDSSMPGS
jgi:hypothetical protein